MLTKIQLSHRNSILLIEEYLLRTKWVEPKYWYKQYVDNTNIVIANSNIENNDIHISNIGNNDVDNSNIGNNDKANIYPLLICRH